MAILSDVKPSGNTGDPLQNVLDKIENVTGSNGQFEARCPCHDDGTNSLCVGTGDDGRVLLKCQAGCKTEDILSAIGLSLSDLFPDSNGSQKRGSSKIERVYDYKDENGQLLFQVVRFQDKRFRQRRPKPSDGWEWKLNGVRRVPYWLPELIAADSRETVFVPEGEKDVDRLRSMGLIATCNPQGLGNGRRSTTSR